MLSERRGANAYSDLIILNLDQTYDYFSLIRVFNYYVHGTRVYLNEKLSEAETNHNYNTRFVVNQILVYANVSTSKIAKYFF